MNVFTCTTRCYKDAEQRHTKDGDSVVSFKGAVDAGFGDKKTTSWIKFNLWGKRFEKLAPYLLDKTQVCVSGELANRKYTDKDGQERYSLEVRVTELTLVGKSDASSSGSAKEAAPAKKQAVDFDDMDAPF